MPKTKQPNPTLTTYDQWLADGKQRFGQDFLQWRFVCPICHHIAAVADYAPFKDCGANPDSATQECIGRYSKPSFKAFSNSTKDRGQPCNYAVYGLFKFPGVIIEMPDGAKRMAFSFADPGL